MVTIPRSLTRLKNLYCNNCPNIREIPETFEELELLQCNNCPQLISIPNLKKLENLSCSKCPELQNIPDIGKNLESLDLSKCGLIKNIPNTLKNLINLNISDCPLIEHIPDTLKSLLWIGCNNCPSLKNIPDIKKLTGVSCEGCPNLINIPETLVNLRELSCSDCINLTEIPDTLTKLKVLICNNCPLLHIPIEIRKQLAGNCKGDACDRPPRVTIHAKIQELLKLSGDRYNFAPETSWDLQGALQSSIGCFEAEAGTLCDINDQSDYKNQEYLDEDPNNIIFMIPSGDNGFKAYGTNIISIVYDKNTDLFLNCDPVPKGTEGAFRYAPLGGDIQSFNLDLDELYVILRFDYQIYVSLNELIGALGTEQRVFLLQKTDTKFLSTVAYSTAYGFKNRVPYDMTSGDHCQEGTEKVISKIYVCVGDKC